MSLKSQEDDSSKLKKYSLEEYFELEYKSEFKNEYHDGYIVPITSATENHGRIVSNMVFLLQNCLRNTECDVFASDRMVYTAKCNRIFYPDLTLVCGERQYYQYSKNMKATTNPSILIEVISNSTANIDRGDKLRCYRSLKSLKQYILVEQDFKNIEIYESDEKGRWVAKIYEEEEDVLKMGDCEIAINDIYLKVDLIEPNAVSD